MSRDEFLRRYRWLPADTDDRLDWLVMVGAAWMLYAAAFMGCLLRELVRRAWNFATAAERERQREAERGSKP